MARRRVSQDPWMMVLILFLVIVGVVLLLRQDYYGDDDTLIVILTVGGVIGLVLFSTRGGRTEPWVYFILLTILIVGLVLILRRDYYNRKLILILAMAGIIGFAFLVMGRPRSSREPWSYLLIIALGIITLIMLLDRYYYDDPLILILAIGGVIGLIFLMQRK